MPNVEALWAGKCEDHLVQEALCTEINRLALASHNMFEKYFKRKIYPVFHDETMMYQDFLVGKSLFSPDPVPDTLVEANKDGFFKPKVTMADEGNEIKQIGELEPCFLGRNLSLFGTSFILFDPRAFKQPFMIHHNYEVSFVFIHAEDRSLNGKLVRVIDIQPGNPLSLYGEKILVAPTLDLRYYLENWTRRFLGWVRYFYIPDLYYWIYGDYGGDEDYKGYSPTNRKEAAQALDTLIASFQEEARAFSAWCDEVEEKERQQKSDPNQKGD